VRSSSAGILLDLAENAAVAIFAAGAIPLLVPLLGPGIPGIAQHAAAGVLGRLTYSLGNAAAIAAAGAIPPLLLATEGSLHASQMVRSDERSSNIGGTRVFQ
jgi:hypothetical protein